MASLESSVRHTKCERDVKTTLPEGSIPLRARIWLWRINLAWSKLIDADRMNTLYTPRDDKRT